jgi:hypothetical protein
VLYFAATLEAIDAMTAGGHLERRVTVLDAVAARDPGEIASAGTGLAR